MLKSVDQDAPNSEHGSKPKLKVKWSPSSDLQALAANLENMLRDVLEKAFTKLQTSRTATTLGTDDARVTQNLGNSTRKEMAQLALGSPENML